MISFGPWCMVLKCELCIWQNGVMMSKCWTHLKTNIFSIVFIKRNRDDKSHHVILGTPVLAHWQWTILWMALKISNEIWHVKIEELGSSTRIKETRPVFNDFLTLKILGPNSFTMVVYEMLKNYFLIVSSYWKMIFFSHSMSWPQFPPFHSPVAPHLLSHPEAPFFCLSLENKQGW